MLASGSIESACVSGFWTFDDGLAGNISSSGSIVPFARPSDVGILFLCLLCGANMSGRLTRYG